MLEKRVAHSSLPRSPHMPANLLASVGHAVGWTDVNPTSLEFMVIRILSQINLYLLINHPVSGSRDTINNTIQTKSVRKWIEKPASQGSDSPNCVNDGALLEDGSMQRRPYGEGAGRRGCSELEPGRVEFNVPLSICWTQRIGSD